MKVANPTENIKNPWEAKIKVANPTENLLEVLYLPEVKNYPQTPMGEREEMVMLPKNEMVIANEADDSVGGATRSCGSRGRRGCSSRGSCPQREGKRKTETVIILLKKCNLKRT